MTKDLLINMVRQSIHVLQTTDNDIIKARVLVRLSTLGFTKQQLEQLIHTLKYK